ncbi:hypothetical protein [Halorubrum sp. FL23]|uniref:hypothetical protein n=1 Tax=Halorubrum sp. FL23 TaxID=3458704 RepID=UPI0040344DEA
MLDDFFSAFHYFRNVDSNSPETTIGKGRKVVRKYAFVIVLAVAAGVVTGILPSPDALLLSIYTLIPFVFDSSLILNSIPLIGRAAPRVMILVELGNGIGAASIGITLSTVYTIYRKVGAASMTVSWLQWKRNN